MGLAPYFSDYLSRLVAFFFFRFSLLPPTPLHNFARGSTSPMYRSFLNILYIVLCVQWILLIVIHVHYSYAAPLRCADHRLSPLRAVNLNLPMGSPSFFLPVATRRLGFSSPSPPISHWLGRGNSSGAHARLFRATRPIGSTGPGDQMRHTDWLEANCTLDGILHVLA